MRRQYVFQLLVSAAAEDSTTVTLFCQNNKAWAGGSMRTAPTLFGDYLTIGYQSTELQNQIRHLPYGPILHLHSIGSISSHPR